MCNHWRNRLWCRKLDTFEQRQRKLKATATADSQFDAGKGTPVGEGHDDPARRLMRNPRRGVGRRSHQLLDVYRSVGDGKQWWQWLVGSGQPPGGPPHPISGKPGKGFGHGEPGGRAQLQVAHLEDPLVFLNPGFDRLAAVVPLKPANRIGGDAVGAVVQKRAVPDRVSGLEALDSGVERIRAGAQAYSRLDS